MRENKLVILAPCFNEEEIIDYSIEQLTAVVNSLIEEGVIAPNSQICYVDDGSKDRTVEKIKRACETNDKIALIELTRNFGQQYAIIAGLNTINADIVVTIDADIQDDLSVIKQMVEKYQEGYEIVYGCRKKRDADSFLKRNTAMMFYKFMNMIGVCIRPNHSEFRLMSRYAINNLKDYTEKTIFLRGIVQNLGLKSIDIYYDGLERIAGQTKYSFFKLFELAWSAITSFSILPLRMITVLGMLTSLVSVLILIYGIVSYFKHYSTPGWTSIIMTIAFFSGIIILSLGIIGEYLSKILIEVKERPLYQVGKTVNLK